MTTAEKTLKWWNDYLEQKKTYPLVAEIEMQLNLAVDSEKQVKNLAIHDVSNRISDSGLRELYRKGYNDGFDNKTDDKLATDLIEKRIYRIKKNYGC